MMLADETHYETKGRVRINTVRADFGFLRREMSLQEMVQFVQEHLDLPPEKVERMQWNTYSHQLYVQLGTWMEAQRLVANHTNRHRYPPLEAGDRRITLTLVDQPTDVTLYDLSELVTVDQVLHAIEPYGVVYSIGRNVWGTGTSFVGILSGHWTVCMVMKRPVPSQLRVGREITHVSYPGQWIRRRPNAWKRLHLLAGRTYRALRGSVRR